MSKESYSVSASKCNEMDDIFFKKKDNGMIYISLNGESLDFTVKEVKEIIDKLKKCILD